MASRARRPLLALLAAVAAALAITGCVSMPNAGPVLSYPVTQETGGQNGQNMQFIVQPPGDGSNPQQIVNGFLLAAAAFGNQAQVARQYLTPDESKNWNPAWGASVYYQAKPSAIRAEPGLPGRGARAGRQSIRQVAPPGALSQARAKQRPKTATVAISGKIKAILSSNDGSYAVPSASGPNASGPLAFSLVNTDGQWRISGAPPELLLTPTQFADDYELRNLYFFDPNYHYLVPDPVYVPLQASASTLTTRLVAYLDKQPQDWLAYGATQTAFPASAKVSATLSNNLATVTLTGKFSKTQLTQMASQLLWTLVGSGAGGAQVDSLAMIVNGKQYFPAGNAANPVQNKSQASYGPAASASATGASPEFYYADSAGDVYSRVGVGATAKQTLIVKLGAGYTQIAVSKDGKYLAALRGGALFIGPVAGLLAKRQSGGAAYATLSWGIRPTICGRRPATATRSSCSAPMRDRGHPAGEGRSWSITCDVLTCWHPDRPAVHRAADRARRRAEVAMITDNDELAFGAIDWGGRDRSRLPRSRSRSIPLAVLRQQPHQRVQRGDVVRAG